MAKFTLLCVVTLLSVAGAAGARAQNAAPAPAQLLADDSELAAMSGGANLAAVTNTSLAIALTEQDLTAINTGNRITADTVTTGAITLSGGAFADFNGVGNVIMNTGNNNNIQTSMSVTIVIAPSAP